MFLALPLLLTLAAAPLPVAQRVDSLHHLTDVYWEWFLAHNPETASIYGDRRFGDQLSDVTVAGFERQRGDLSTFLVKLEAIDPSGFPTQEALNRAILANQLRTEITDLSLKNYELLATQLNGPHLDFGELLAVLPFENEKDFADYLTRLRAYPATLDQSIVTLRQGIADHLVQPRYIIAKMVTQTHAMALVAPDQSPLLPPAARFEKGLPADKRDVMRSQMVAAIRDGVLPALGRFEHFLGTEYLAAGRAHEGIWELPDGEARYRTAIRRMTTTDQTPEVIHATGLREVERIEKEIDALVHRAGFKDEAAFLVNLRAHAPDAKTWRTEILVRFRTHIAAMEGQLPRLFSHLPKAKLDVLPVEAYREKDAPGAEYTEGSNDGSRPGHVMVNPGWSPNEYADVEATAYHEGLPGHHLQIALAKEIPTLPAFRQHADYNAFIEGWALYAEYLGKEVGFYTDPVSDYGRLESERFRAVRLVVDTGLHALRWNREQVLTYMKAHCYGDPTGLAVEADRYVVWPGQALGYKLGQLEILALRHKAKAELGARFDLRAFHDAVLAGGALPLDVLTAQIDAWIAEQVKK